MTINEIPVAEVEQAAERLRGIAMRTPLVRLDGHDGPGEIWLKLENLQPVGSFKIRGAGNAIAQLSAARRSRGVVTASAGNMAQGVAWNARRLGIPCTVVVPDSAPRAKLAAIERLGARIDKVPFDRWWQIMLAHEYDAAEGVFIHPVADRAVIAGNGTIGIEILEDLPEVAAVVVPFGGGGLSCGIASAIRARRLQVPVFAAEVETAAPLVASLAAGGPVAVDHAPSFVDGIGGKSVLPTMWPLIEALIDGSFVVSLDAIAGAIRLLVERNRIVAEGAGAAAVAAARGGIGIEGPVVCVVSGGNLDAETLATILAGGVPG